MEEARRAGARDVESEHILMGLLLAAGAEPMQDAVGDEGLDLLGDGEGPPTPEHTRGARAHIPALAARW